MIKPIEHFILRNLQPTYSDTESVTCLELVGKNTTKINEIVEVVNSFIDEVNTTIETFITDTTKDYETFKVAMEQKFQDFIDIIDLKCKDQDKHIEEELINIKNLALEYCKEQLDNIKVDVEKLVDEKLATFKTELDESNENLISEINNNNELFRNEFITTNEYLLGKLYDLNELVNNLLYSKQDTLIAGDNITIEGNVISAITNIDSGITEDKVNEIVNDKVIVREINGNTTLGENGQVFGSFIIANNDTEYSVDPTIYAIGEVRAFYKFEKSTTVNVMNDDTLNDSYCYASYTIASDGTKTGITGAWCIKDENKPNEKVSYYIEIIFVKR